MLGAAKFLPFRYQLLTVAPAATDVLLAPLMEVMIGNKESTAVVVVDALVTVTPPISGTPLPDGSALHTSQLPDAVRGMVQVPKTSKTEFWML